MHNACLTKKLIDEKIQKYDSEKCLIVEHHTPNYHSNLTPGEYCFINSSTKLAAAIFSCSYEKYYSVACIMLGRIISLQCKEGENAGLWSYFFEETIDEMVSPDHNYADFNAYVLLYILKEHKDKLEKDLYEGIKDACVLACKAIMRRDLTVIYTNPTIMGSYCTIVCGEMFGIRELFEYGKNKLDKLYFRIMNTGTYDEYNCPGYSMLIANIYSLMLSHIDNPDILNKVDDLNRIVWKMLVEHYHYGLDEFTGPNSRQYFNFSDTKDFRAAVGLEKDSDDILGLVYKTKCPDDLVKSYVTKEKTADYMRTVSTGYIYPYLGYPMVDTQHIRQKYTLGSFSMNDCWNQRRNVVSYIGDSIKKVCIRLRAYHDGYDFCSAFTSTAQSKNTALSLTNFHTNRGDTHVDLDPVKNATISAKKLSVLYQIEANRNDIIDTISIKKTESGCKLQILGIKAEISFPFMENSGFKPYVEISKTDREMLVEAVLYSGEQSDIDLNALDSLVVVSVLSIEDGFNEDIRIIKNEELIIAETNSNGKLLTVTGPYKPLKQAHSVLLNEVLINGENVIKLQEQCK